MFFIKVYRDNTMNVEEVLLERSSPIGPSQINAGWNNPPHGDNSGILWQMKKSIIDTNGKRRNGSSASGVIFCDRDTNL